MMMTRTLVVALVFGFTAVGGLRGDEPGSGEVTETPAPPLLPLLPQAKRIIEELPITAAEREDILGHNALKLLQR